MVILEVYERNLSELMDEFTAVEDSSKAEEVVTASLDVRAAFSQLAALAATFCQKSKDKDMKKEVAETREAKQKSHTELQLKAATVQKKLTSMRTTSGGGTVPSQPTNNQPSMKPVAELQPTTTAHFKLSGVDFEKWTKEMTVWATASKFASADATVQAAFAQKHVEKELDEKIREKAEADGVILTFENYVKLAEALFREQSSIFLRRVEFFQLRPKETSAKALLTYLTKLQTEFKAAEVETLMNAEDFATYKVISEMPATMRPKVIENTQKGVTCAELKAQLERLHDLKQMEEALEVKKTPRVFKIGSGQGTSGTSGGRGGAGAGGGNAAAGVNLPRRGLPPGLDISKVGCLKCNSFDGHRAAQCPHKDLFCKFCSRKGHVSDVCFRRLEAEGAIPAKEPVQPGTPTPAQPTSRAASPAGGRPPTPHHQHTLGTIKAYSVSEKQQRDNMPRMRIKLWTDDKKKREKEADTLFDTGASVSILNLEVAKSMELAFSPHSNSTSTLKLASADEREIPVEGYAYIWVKSPDAKYRRRIKVCVVANIDEEFILGIDHLKALKYIPPGWPDSPPGLVEAGYTSEEEEEEDEKNKEACYMVKTEEEKIEDIEKEMGTEKKEVEDEEMITTECCYDLFPDEETVEDIPGINQFPQKLQDILRSHKKVFSNKLRKENAINWPPVKVEMKEDAKYPKTVTRARQPPAALFDQASQQIKELEREGILVKVTEPTTYNSAGFWLPKSSDRTKARFLSDQRGTNEIIKRTYHPAYDPQQIIRTMAPNLQCYWVADMSSSYHQLRISEESSKKFFNVLTAFGVYRFTRIIQGCSISSDVLGTAMEHRFGDILSARTLARDMDDWISGSETEEQAMTLLETFLDRCEANNIILSPKKFQWGGQGGAVKWAGLLVQQGTSQPDPDRIKALALIREPHDKSSLRRWLGTVNTLGNYIQGISKKTSLQRDLLRKDSAWIWSDEVKAEFLSLREELSNPNHLFTYSKDMDIGISIDSQSGGGNEISNCTGVGFHAFQYYRDEEKAKSTGLGGPLGGRGWNKVQSLQFGSIAAKPSWKQKAAMIVELLGTISALYKLDFFTRGQQVLDIFLDSKPIVQAWEGKGLDNLSPALQPLLIELAKWPVRLHWVQGKSHVVPDTLGRAAVEGHDTHHPGVDQVEQHFPHLSGGAAGEYTLAEVGNTIHRLFTILSSQDDEDIGGEHLAWELAFQELFDAADADPKYKQVCQEVQDGLKLADIKNSHPANPAKMYQKWWNSLSVLKNSKDQQLLIMDGLQVVVPHAMRKELLERVHAHHKGVQLTKAFLDRYYFWPDIHAHVRNMCQSCSTCEEHRPSKPVEKQPKMFRPKKPWEALALDFFLYQGKHILLSVDMLTNYIILHHFNTAPSTSQILQALDTIFLANGGFPKIVATDGQLSLNSAEFNDYCNQKWILHRLSSVGNSRSNGAAERSIGEVRRTFDKVARDKGANLTKADMALTLALLNDTPRISQTASPSFLHFRRQFRHAEFPALEVTKPDSFFEAQEEDRTKRREAKRESDNSRISSETSPAPMNLQVGLKVLLQDKKSKLFNIPGEIVKVKSKRSAIIRNKETGNLMLRNRRFLREDLSWKSPKVIGSVNAIKRVGRNVVRKSNVVISALKSKQIPPFGTRKKVSFTMDLQVNDQAAAGEASKEEEEKERSMKNEQKADSLQLEPRQGAGWCEEEEQSSTSPKFDPEIERFIWDWSKDSTQDPNLECVKREQEAIRRIRKAGSTTRSTCKQSHPATDHARQCSRCSKLSVALPSFVRACINSDNNDYEDQFIPFEDYTSIPGNKIFDVFHSYFLDAQL